MQQDLIPANSEDLLVKKAEGGDPRPKLVHAFVQATRDYLKYILSLQVPQRRWGARRKGQLLNTEKS